MIHYLGAGVSGSYHMVQNFRGETIIFMHALEKLFFHKNHENICTIRLNGNST